MTHKLPKLRAIRKALLTVPARRAGFPFGTLHDSAILQKIRTVPHLQQVLSDMRAEAQRAQAIPLETLPFSLFHLFETTGERTTYERVYFDRRRRLSGLTLTSVIDETDQYLPALSDLIWEICNEYTWSLPAHLQVGVEAIKAYRVPPEQVVDLFAAETAHALAEILSLLGERLDSWLHYRIRNEIEWRIFQPIFNTAYHFEWESATMNWAAVCGGCVGMTALILEDDRDRLIGMIDRVVRTMECFLEGFGEDGGCPEGIGYWVYGFGYYTYFAEMLHAYTDGQLDLLQGEHIRRIASFPGVISFGKTQYINFSDSPESVKIPPGLGSHLIDRLQVTIPDLTTPDFHDDPIYRWAHIVRDLAWTDAHLLNQAILEGSFYLRDVAWVIDKHIMDGKAVAFSAKGGHNGEPHNHNDLGHFILHVDGESLLVDLGAGVYTRQYFAEARYDHLHTGSHGHSVPVINGHKQSAGLSYAASVMNYETRPDGINFVLDLTSAYADDSLKSFVRSFDWSIDSLQKTAMLGLMDTFEFSNYPEAVEECFVSLIQPRIEQGKVCWESEHGKVIMTYDGQHFDARIESIETQTHSLESVTIYRLLLSAVSTNHILQYIFTFKYQLSTI